MPHSLAEKKTNRVAGLRKGWVGAWAQVKYTLRRRTSSYFSQCMKVWFHVYWIPTSLKRLCFRVDRCSVYLLQDGELFLNLLFAQMCALRNCRPLWWSGLWNRSSRGNFSKIWEATQIIQVISLTSLEFSNRILFLVPREMKDLLFEFPRNWRIKLENKSHAWRATLKVLQQEYNQIQTRQEGNKKPKGL